MGRKTVGRFVTDVTTPVAIEADRNIVFNGKTISTKCVSYDGNGGIKLNGQGLYMIYANFTATATAVGNIGIQMYEDGTAVPGAHGISSAAAVGDVRNIAFNGVITVRCNCDKTLTFRSSVDTSYNIANVIVEKVA